MRLYTNMHFKCRAEVDGVVCLFAGGQGNTLENENFTSQILSTSSNLQCHQFASVLETRRLFERSEKAEPSDPLSSHPEPHKGGFADLFSVTRAVLDRNFDSNPAQTDLHGED